MRAKDARAAGLLAAARWVRNYARDSQQIYERKRADGNNEWIYDEGHFDAAIAIARWCEAQARAARRKG